MTETITSAQMRALEQAAIESGQVTGLELMERAGQGVVEAVFEAWPELAMGEGRAVVLCGPGNNGGDGFVVARLLREKGWEVEVFLYGDADKLPPDARVNYERWCEGGDVSALSCREFWLDPDSYSSSTVLVDAVFGTGLRRAFDCNAVVWALLTCALNSRREPNEHWPAARVVAIDVPSGMDADTGMFPKPDPIPFDFETAKANLTVTFHSLKRGHVLADGPAACGKIVVKDIGL